MSASHLIGDFSAAIFDMDGTLVDSTALVEQEWSEWAILKGLDPVAVAHFAHGRKTEDTILHYLSDIDLPQEMSLFRSMAGRLDQSSVVPIAGALSFVHTVSGTGWAVVTSAPGDIARRRLAICGFPIPNVLVSADDVCLGKPDPEGFRSACKRLGQSPSCCVVFEDAPAGVAAALEASTRVVVLRTTHPTDEFEGCVQVNDFQDVVAELLPNKRFRLTLRH